MHQTSATPPPSPDPVSSRRPEERFTDRVASYVAHRPSYPAAVVDWVFEGLGPPAGLVIADIGAGTGISSRLLALSGARVLAVEPNAAMRAAGESVATPNIEWRAGTGESTGLSEASVHVVTCFQAFHWLDHRAALVEFARILCGRNPQGGPGRLAIVWNVQDESDEATRAYREIILRHASDPPTSPSFTGHQHVPDLSRGDWRSPSHERFTHAQLLDEEGLVGRALSASYSPNEGPARVSLERELRGCFARFQRDGVFSLRYEVHAHRAGRVPRAGES